MAKRYVADLASDYYAMKGYRVVRDVRLRTAGGQGRASRGKGLIDLLAVGEQEAKIIRCLDSPGAAPARVFVERLYRFLEAAARSLQRRRPSLKGKRLTLILVHDWRADEMGPRQRLLEERGVEVVPLNALAGRGTPPWETRLTQDEVEPPRCSSSPLTSSRT